MFIIRFIQLQFLLLLTFLVCTSVAGEQQGVFWFMVVVLTLGTLFLIGKVVQSRR